LYSITGLHVAEILELCELIHRAATDSERTWPPFLGLYTSVVVTLAYQRGNRTQAELAATYQTSQASVSRAIAAITPLQAKALRPFVPTAEELDPAKQYLVDGTLLPCWSWADHPELYSGKHKTTGMNLQVVASLDGELAWISDPVDGCHHDVYCLDESGALLTLDPGNWTGDKGYVGRGMVTPYKKPPKGKLLDWQKTFNSAINKTRAVIEQVVSHVKNWRILHTDYRRPLATFPTTISAVVGLHFWLNG
jgi:DDE superfamily endonuclease